MSPPSVMSVGRRGLQTGINADVDVDVTKRISTHHPITAIRVGPECAEKTTETGNAYRHTLQAVLFMGAA